jgi:hypothetical protein
VYFGVNSTLNKPARLPARTGYIHKTALARGYAAPAQAYGRTGGEGQWGEEPVSCLD